MKKNVLTIILLLFLINYTKAQQKGFAQLNGLNAQFEKIGRGICDLHNNTLLTKEAYAAFGKGDGWKDCEIRFKGRVPDSAKQVQLSAGFHAANRDDRYILMLKGGNEKFLYLARLGYMGSDDFLAIRQLDFHPTPGKWYSFRIQLAGSRIRVFINDERLPRIDITDKSSNLAPSGKVTLGGSWVANEFKDLQVNAVGDDFIPGMAAVEYAVQPLDKKILRRKQRAAYQPIEIKSLSSERSDISLNGKWLFAPGYEIANTAQAVAPFTEDSTWHILEVPNFWNPIRVWQHGEHYNTASKGVADNYWQKEIERCEGYTFDYEKTSVGWYRQWITLPKEIKGKNVQLSFDAVSKVGEVWVNGKKAGEHIGMFGDFKLDVTRFLTPGKNLIAVKVVRDYVKNIKDADKIAGVAVTVEVTQKMVQDLAHGFFNDDPAGIWQPVTLTITNPLRIEDVFIKPDLKGAAFEITIKNNTKTAQNFALATAIKGNGFSDRLYQNVSLKDIKLNAGETKLFSYRIADLHPRLWSPEHPSLYDFDFTIVNATGANIDKKKITSGFRTFEARGDYLYLNGKRYWLRGGNQTAMPLAPNDSAMADHFNKLMKAGNIMVTRTHTVPYNKLWMESSDKNGVGVSYEGTWPWLFLESSMPEQQLIDLWKNEFYDLIRKYRNNPSLLFWTMNNEMKFYDNDPDPERAKLKMRIISDVVKKIRTIDPTRPVVFDSNYTRRTKRFGEAFYKDIDDGDIDDPHAYYNWYDYSIFDFFKGEWQKNNKNDGRPLICQEMSTGYTDETGHPSRYYTYMHQNPASLVGKYAYEYNDPYYFLTAQAFISKELGEALRRSNEKSAGILHFSTLTWFKNVDDVKKLEPWPVYYQMKTALQPVLVTAELWGRHFYAGTKIAAQICIVNDREDGTTIPAGKLKWQLIGNDKKKLAEGEYDVPSVEHYGRKWISPEIIVPADLPQDRINGQLILELKSEGKMISENYYDLTFMKKQAAGSKNLLDKRIAVLDRNNGVTNALRFFEVKYDKAETVTDFVNQKADIYILSGVDSSDITADELMQLKVLQRQGRNILISQCGTLARLLFPQYIRSVLTDSGEVANMEIPESPVFNQLEPLDIRNFNDNKRQKPSVIDGAFRIKRNEKLNPLASITKIHGYLPGTVEERMKKLDKIKGYPIVEIKDNGRVILSEMRIDKALTDPVAGTLLINMLNALQ